MSLFILILDAAALQCCSGHTEEDIKKHLLTPMLDIFNPENFKEFEGDLIPTRIKMIKEKKTKELEQKRMRELEYQRKMEQQRAKEREYLRKKREEKESRENNAAMVSNDTKVLDLDYDNTELKPKIDEQPLQKKVNDDQSEKETVLIKKQSKDETTIEFLGDKFVKDPKKSVFDSINDFVLTYLPTGVPTKKKFDADDFFKKLQRQPLYKVNQSWIEDFALLTCPAQMFKERFSIQGEFFDSYL